jgi:S-DNA-T family DNA segregation ATPase FtsK/SpoIIIE
VDAGNLDTYRRAAARPAEPRILLLIDGFAQFRQNYETSRLLFFDQLQQIASDGRQVGVHLVLTADRGATVPSAIASAIQRRLVLRLASDHDYYGLAEVDAEALDTAPPGRGFLGGLEIQVAVLAGTNDVARQAAAVRALATELRRDHRASEAPPIERLVEHIDLAELPDAIDGLPAFGIADESLAPIGFVARGSFLVVGPHQSGCTTVTATLAAALRRITPDIQLALFTLARSPLIGALDWSEVHTDLDAIVDACDRLQSELKAGVTKIAVVIESFPDFAQSSADMALEALVKTARSVGVIVIAEGESASVIGAYGGFVTAIKADRQGVALQPEQTDGDVIFKTAFPRVSRSAFPPGRGLYVSAGRVSRVQCAEQRQ